MRSTVIRRTALAVSVASCAFVVTACGGGADTKDGASAPEPAAKALTAAELNKRVVTQGDVKDHEIKKPGKKDAFAPGSVSVAKAACDPVGQVLSALPPTESVASVQRLVVHESAAAKKSPR